MKPGLSLRVILRNLELPCELLAGVRARRDGECRGVMALPVQSRMEVAWSRAHREQAIELAAREHAAGYIRVAREADRTRHGPGRRSGCGRSRKTILGKGFRQPSPGMLIEYVFY